MYDIYYENKYVTLYHGDCMEVIPNLGDLSESIVVSDPPYNMSYHYNSYKDNKSEENYYNWLAGIFSGHPSVVIHYSESLYRIAMNMHIVPDKVVAWVYNSNTPRQHRDIAFFGVKPDFTKVLQPYKNPKDKRIRHQIADGNFGCKLYDWWKVNQIKNISYEKTKHPCQTPLEIMDKIVRILPNDMRIIDPFSGSGTTGVACMKARRKCVLIEQDELYCKIAKERLEESFDLFNMYEE